MKLCVIGTGYVGLVSGTCLAELGHDVVCVDTNTAKIEELRAGRIPIYEPGLEELVKANQEVGRLSFTTEVEEVAASGTNIFFITVGTPADPLDGGANLEYVFAAVKSIATYFARAGRRTTEQVVFVTKSTVPVGTNRTIEEIVGRYLPSTAFAIASNPEFLREGAALQDFMRPDRIVIGSACERARALLEDVYRPLSRSGVPIHVVSSVQTAELIKYAANAFLATKITFINEVARLSEAAGADIAEVVAGIGSDRRVGLDFLSPGPGYGGSCFPKDTQALVKTAIEFNSPLTVVEAVIAANHRHKVMMITKIRNALGGSLAGKRLAILGLAFKANTDDMRESPALVIVPGLVRQGAIVVGHDPIAFQNAKALMPDIRIEREFHKAVEGVDAAVILTEWPEFATLDLDELMAHARGKLVIDLRNVVPKEKAAAFSGRYFGIGKPDPHDLRTIEFHREVA
jgi:UDPglucose 6-dehydrogenase